MQHITSTPFGRRAVSADLRETVQATKQVPQAHCANKYEILRQLGTARSRFNVSDRDLMVLSALMSFHRGELLKGDQNLIVFPSNRTLAARAHGMPESTLRRHLANLVKAGLLLRHDSPNGKRYVRRTKAGEIARAFGFDLRALLSRACEIEEAAQAVEAEREAIRVAREDAVLMLRDTGKLALYGQGEGVVANWDEVADQVALYKRALRRKLGFSKIDELRGLIEALLRRVEEMLTPIETINLSGCVSQNERHQQTTKTEEYISVEDLVEACPDIADYSAEPIRHWHEIAGISLLVSQMLGIRRSLWDEAYEAMGMEGLSIVIAVMLQNGQAIHSPKGYLEALVRKSLAGRFEPLSLLRDMQRRREGWVN